LKGNQPPRNKRYLLGIKHKNTMLQVWKEHTWTMMGRLNMRDSCVINNCICTVFIVLMDALCTLEQCTHPNWTYGDNVTVNCKHWERKVFIGRAVFVLQWAEHTQDSPVETL
jgi:hypothetical protein